MRRNQIDQDHYVVEKIIGKKTVKEKIFYKVKWQGYSEDQCTWEKKSHLRYVTSLIEEFQNQETAFANAMKSSLGSYEDSSNQSPSVVKNSIDVYNGSFIAKQSQLMKKSTRRFESLQKRMGPNKIEREEIQLSSYENKDSTSHSGSIQRCQPKKSIVNKSKKKKQSKKVQKKKKVERKMAQTSKRSSSPERERPNSVIKSIQFEQKRIKGQQVNDKQEKGSQIVIRLLESEDKHSDINDYVVIYRSGKSKIYSTWQLFYAHPVEFVGYLETKAKRGRN